jgi:hypothetical protein
MSEKPEKKKAEKKILRRTQNGAFCCILDIKSV